MNTIIEAAYALNKVEYGSLKVEEGKISAFQGPSKGANRAINEYKINCRTSIHSRVRAQRIHWLISPGLVTWVAEK